MELVPPPIHRKSCGQLVGGTSVHLVHICIDINKYIDIDIDIDVGIAIAIAIAIDTNIDRSKVSLDRLLRVRDTTDTPRRFEKPRSH